MPGVFKDVFQYFTTTQPVNKQYNISLRAFSGSWNNQSSEVLGYNAIWDNSEYPSDTPTAFTVATSSIGDEHGGSITGHASPNFHSRDIYNSVHSTFYNKVGELNVGPTGLFQEIGTHYTYISDLFKEYDSYIINVDPSNYAYQLDREKFYGDYYEYWANRSLRNTKFGYYPRTFVNTVISESQFRDELQTGVPFYKKIKKAYPDMDRWFSTEARVISIPQRLFGTGIQPNTLRIESGSVIITDDGLGNLRDESRANHIISSSRSTLLDFDFANMFLIQKNRQLNNLNTSQSVIINSGSRYPNRLTVDRSWYGGNDFEIHRFHDRIDYGIKKAYIDFPGYLDRKNRVNKNPLLFTTKLNTLGNFSQSKDYSVYCRFRLPQSQSEYSAPYNWLFGKGKPHSIPNAVYPHTQSTYPRTPFQVKVWNDTGGVGDLVVGTYTIGGQGDTSLDGKVEFMKSDLEGQAFLTSSTSLNDGVWHDLVINSTGSKLEMWIDAQLVATSSAEDPHSPNPISGPIHYTPVDDYGNSYANNLWIAAGVDANYVASFENNTTGQLVQRGYNITKDVEAPCSCSIQNFKLWNKALNSNEISFLTNQISGSQTPYIGNVFYETGMVVITDPSSSYKKIPDNANIWFANQHEITEHEYLCTIDKSEFNVSTNPSLLANQLTKEFKPIVSSSAFTPYISTIGLYNNDNELLVIGKLGQALKKVSNYDINIVVRFDT
jgi:hypothetical protein